MSQLPEEPEEREPLLPEAQLHYNAGLENERLAQPSGLIELRRSQELIKRYLPPPPAIVLDVGGGAGVYSLWLAQQGYTVHLVDPMPLHIEQARQASALQPATPLASASLGDARQLNFGDESVQVVLLMGPLYHLIERGDRLTVLNEARRVLQAGGSVLAVGISRYASALDGMFGGLLDDPDFVEIVQCDLTDGQHRNPKNHPYYFTTAYFHHPDELKAEIEAAGLHHEKTLAVEGPAWLSAYVKQNWQDESKREMLLNIVRRIEEEPTLLGSSAHLMAVARKI